MRALVRLPIAACLLALLLLPAPPSAPRAAAAAASTECRGDACPSVTLTFDDAKQQYRARNNSADRWVRVTASNYASASAACLAPLGEGHLVLKSVVGPFRAEYVEPGCGQGPAGE